MSESPGLSQDELISVIDIARQHNIYKSTVFRVLKRLGITTVKQRNSLNRNQIVSYITHEDFKLVNDELLLNVAKNEFDDSDGDATDSNEQGVFYLVQLETTHDPGRFKVGFAINMAERLRHLKCSAPFATIIKTWPCRRLWGKDRN